MKAWVIDSYGGPEVLRRTNIDTPIIKKGGILIEVKYVALNPYDYKLRNGVAKMMTGKKFPKVFGGDFSGVIVESDDKDSTLQVGQAVYGFANLFMREQGCLAEYATMSTKYVRPIPEGFDLKQASALTSAGLTALNGIQKCGALKDRKVLVNGATGGVGHFATQILAAKGAKVTAVCSGQNADLATSLGAERVIDYRKDDALQDDMTYDIIYDAAAKLSYPIARKHLNRAGVYCTTEESLSAGLQLLKSKFSLRTGMTLSSFRGKTGDFEEIEKLAISKDVMPSIQHQFPFAETDKAFELLENGKSSGKIVINIKG